MKTIILILTICNGGECNEYVPETWKGDNVQQEMATCKKFGADNFKAGSYRCEIEQQAETVYPSLCFYRTEAAQ